MDFITALGSFQNSLLARHFMVLGKVPKTSLNHKMCLTLFSCPVSCHRMIVFITIPEFHVLIISSNEAFMRMAFDGFMPAIYTTKIQQENGTYLSL